MQSAGHRSGAAKKPVPASTAKAENGTPGGKSDKYQRILDAAIAVIAEKGFFTARISDIAERADVADGTVYLYFKSKEDILMKAINAAFDGFMRHALTELAKIESPEKQLRRLAYLHLEAMGSNRNAAKVFQMELRQSTRFLEEFSHDHMVEYFALVREAIRRGQHDGTFRAELSDKVAANCFFGSLDEMVTSWVLSGEDYPLAHAAEHVCDVILKGLEK
ncbi:transcriptional regulator, TetR family [Candidatus Koribacter versatilis Ellin345]|uniref:Transcriptional regulator, TetR family n=2 Tax=Candidatus Korobacter versatilis TaxID=658062 RepID=Q1IPW9_KORVE|nr:transcriptional regulator, TetR family [Candidatus Koribacter versatilis Ellin345]